MATFPLQNFLQTCTSAQYTHTKKNLLDQDLPCGIIQPSKWRRETPRAIQALICIPMNAANDAKQVRDALIEYFTKEGQVPL